MSDDFSVWITTNPVVTWVIRHVASRLDPWLFKATNGRFTSMGAPSMPILTLTPVGRHPGPPGSVGLAGRERGGDPRGVARAFVIAAFDIVLTVYVVAPFFVHQRERIVARRYWLGHRRQFFDVDDDLLGQILGFRTVCTEACRDTLAGEPNLVGGKRMVIGGLEAWNRRFDANRVDPGQTLGGKNTIFFAFGDLDPEQPAMRLLAA